MAYFPKPWTLNQDVMESEYAIFEQTGKDQERKVRLCVGLVALLYELLMVLDGDPLPEVYPVTTDDRAQRWLILFYCSSAFLYSNTGLDLALRGHYLEAEGVLRSLLETSAFAEYFSKNRDECLKFFSSGKGVPDRKRVFGYLKESGQFPKGGPEKVIARFHASAHSNLHARMRSWLLKDRDGRLVGFRIHQYDKESFLWVAHHLVMPLLGAHQFLYEAFRAKMAASREVQVKWNAGRPFELIRQEFPDLWFVLSDNQFAQPPE